MKENNTTNLNLAASWVNGLVPNATDRAVLTTNVTADITTDLGDDLSWRGIALVSNTASWVISGTNKLSMGSSGIDMSQAQADLIIASKLALGTTQIWNVATSRTLTVSGAISGSNTVDLIKTGEGTLVITNAANNYSGNTIISNGILSVANTNVIGTGELRIDGSALSTTANALLTNNVVLTNAVGIANANTLTLSGTITGAGSLTKTGAGQLIIKGTNTYSGGTTNGGYIQIYGKDSLGTGSIVMLSNSTLFATAPAFTLNGPGLANEIILTGKATFANIQTADADVTVVDGPISGTGSLTLSGNQFTLNNKNTFSGGLNLNFDSWLRFNGRDALGTGPLTTTRAAMLLALADAGSDGGITNDIIMSSTFRMNTGGLTVLLSGTMSDAGTLQRIDNNAGVLAITGNNTGRTGSTDWRFGVLRLGHANALGSGILNITANPNSALEVSTDLSAGNGVPNDITLTATMDGDGVISPLALNLNDDLKLSGNISGGTVDGLMVVQKNGTGSLTLSGNSTFNDPIDVNAGSLKVDGTLQSRLITVHSGSILAGTGSVQKVTLEARSAFVSDGGMNFGGDLTLGADVDATLNVNNTSSALRGNGANSLVAAGLLRLDFSANTAVALNDTFTIFSSWATRTDNGTTVQAVGLPPFTMLDTANLFVDGTVKVVSSKVSIAGADMDVIGGQTKTVSFVITNNTGAPMTFNLSDDAVWDVFYAVTTNAPWSAWIANNTNTFLKDPDGSGPETVFTGGYSSNAIPIGFPFKLYGQTFTHFYVSAEGAVGFGTTPAYIPARTSNTLPGGDPVLAPFWSDLTVTNGSITYQSNPANLTIAYKNVKQEGGGSGLQFQTILYTNGQVKLQYQTISGTLAANAACGLQNGTNRVNTGFVPVTGKAVLLTPVNDAWITYSPSGSFTIPAHGSVTITITLDAAGRPVGTSKGFSLFLNSDGTVTELPITATVVAPRPVLTAPDQVIFSGPAGAQTSTTMVLGNTGNVPLTYVINYDAASAVKYSGSIENGLGSGWNSLLTGTINNWITPADANRFVTAADEGYSPLIGIGFPFAFYGNTYTQVSVGVNGGISLGSAGRMSAAGDFNTTRSDVPADFIAPYWGDLQLGSNSVVRQRCYGDKFVVSWINMQQAGNPSGSNLTFQAVLYPDGKVEFLYQQVNGSRWSTTLAGLRSSGKTPVSTNLFLGAGDTYVTTNIVSGTTNKVVVTNIVNSVANRSAQYIPGNIPIITYSPAEGTITNGATVNVTITGDASGLAPVGTNTLINNAQLDISYASINKSVAVQFTVTNSIETALGSPLDSAMDTDGDGISDDNERLAGTDPLDPNSTFAVSTAGGTRTLNWGYAEGRLYTVWYTTSLSEPFRIHPDAARISAAGFTDVLNQNQLAVFYKVTVE
ncbi:MAG: autotransporter-associated beta strand repeat-containing protein [Kiritimatiellales bacterium]